MEKLIKNYQESLQAIYDHVGLVEDWVVCPLDDKTEMVWYIHEGELHYAKAKEDFLAGDGYTDTIYTQRFYQKHVYEGPEMTLVFADPHVDGMKWWRLLDNSKRIKVEDLEG